MGVRGRTMLALSIIIIPLLVLLSMSVRSQYQLAKALQADGHATSLRDTVVSIVKTMVLALSFSVAALALSALVIEMRLLRPMRHLTLAASRLAEGELDTRVDMSRIVIGEMRTLGTTLNTMAGILGKLALTDSLTAIANRRQFDQVVAGEVKRSNRMKKGLALLLVDVDKFKDYNDLYGHGGGDTCLRQIAKALQNGVRRPNDLVARYGGEEFAILLPDTDEEGALIIATELLSIIRALSIPHAGWERGIVTISIGIAVSYPPTVVEPVILTERADQALYAAKQAGRDRVLINELTTRDA